MVHELDSLTQMILELDSQKIGWFETFVIFSSLGDFVITTSSRMWSFRGFLVPRSPAIFQPGVTFSMID